MTAPSPPPPHTVKPPTEGAGEDDVESDDEEVKDPLGAPPAAWRPTPNKGPVQWETPKGTKCSKEVRTVDYQFRNDDDSADVNEQRETVFKMGDAVFLLLVDLRRARGQEAVTLKLLNAREERVFFALRQHSEAGEEDKCEFTQGSALAAG